MPAVSAPPRRARRPAVALRGLVGVALAGLLLASCTASEPQPADGAFDPRQAERMFAAGYQDITTVYIEELTTAELAMAGLEGLSTLDPEFSVSRSDGYVTVSVDGREADRFLAPADRDDSGWALFTTRLIDDMRRRSPELAQADSEVLYEAVFDGMLLRLDGYSRYAGRDEARDNRASRDGFGGIGVRIRVVERGVQVISVMDKTPAEAAGLQPNDLIVAIDGEPAAGLSQREVVRRLRGPIDAGVTLSVERAPAAAPLSLEVVRAHIVPQTVAYRRDGNTAVLKITGFNQSTAHSLRRAMAQAAREIGPALAGYVVDLRSNPGGLLDQAVAVADLFLSEGRIVSTHGRHPDSHQYFEARRDTLVGDLPVAVLVNGNSASASEIVAAALQDSGRAIVVGSNSFGKGTVQTVLRLPNEGELTLTWARFHAPSGYTLNHRGVLPDVCTSGGAGTAEEILDRLSRGLRTFEPGASRAQLAAGDDSAISALRERCPLRESEEEIDLRVALDLLRDPVLYARARNGGAQVPVTARHSDQVSDLRVR